MPTDRGSLQENTIRIIIPLRALSDIPANVEIIDAALTSHSECLTIIYRDRDTDYITSTQVPHCQTIYNIYLKPAPSMTGPKSLEVLAAKKVIFNMATANTINSYWQNPNQLALNSSSRDTLEHSMGLLRIQQGLPIIYVRPNKPWKTQVLTIGLPTCCYLDDNGWAVVGGSEGAALINTETSEIIINNEMRCVHALTVDVKKEYLFILSNNTIYCASLLSIWPTPTLFKSPHCVIKVLTLARPEPSAILNACTLVVTNKYIFCSYNGHTTVYRRRGVIVDPNPFATCPLAFSCGQSYGGTDYIRLGGMVNLLNVPSHKDDLPIIVCAVDCSAGYVEFRNYQSAGDERRLKNVVSSPNPANTVKSIVRIGMGCDCYLIIAQPSSVAYLRTSRSQATSRSWIPYTERFSLE